MSSETGARHDPSVRPQTVREHADKSAQSRPWCAKTPPLSDDVVSGKVDVGQLRLHSDSEDVSGVSPSDRPLELPETTLGYPTVQ